MKASNDLIKKFGVDKIIHGLIGICLLYTSDAADE